MANKQLVSRKSKTAEEQCDVEMYMYTHTIAKRNKI